MFCGQNEIFNLFVLFVQILYIHVCCCTASWQYINYINRRIKHRMTGATRCDPGGHHVFVCLSVSNFTCYWTHQPYFLYTFMTLRSRTPRGCADEQFLKNLFYWLLCFIPPLMAGSSSLPPDQHLPTPSPLNTAAWILQTMVLYLPLSCNN